MSCEYVRDYYAVPAVIGRRVIVGGKAGVIAEDRGHYIGVNFDSDKPGVVHNCHPTGEVEYGEIGVVRKITASQQRYRRFLEYGDGFDSFVGFCRWDAEPERSWNCSY
ncbi:hypothetical protein AAKU64_003997 [Undibacterium sp. GrIS 1.8]|uniref:hypothetical protein n=1 Tax=Undibacterium sp. GrIS 1.8 TaxID=3143934 RepID=UPI003395156F